MNTNGNIYTIIYTTVIVAVVAAILAFASQSLKSRQDDNEKADTISQMLTAAQFATKGDLQKLGNTKVLAKYAEEIEQAFTVGTDGNKISDLDLDKVYSPKELKKQNYKIKDDPAFQGEFQGEKADFADANVFDIVKGGAPKDADGKSVIDNKIDAITGATMTSNGLDAAIDTWLGAYAAYFKGATTKTEEE